MVKDPQKASYKVMAFCSSESYLFEPLKKDVRGRSIRRPWEAIRHSTVEGHALAMSLEHNIFMAVVPEVPGIPKTGVPVRWFETDLPKNGSIYRLTCPEPELNRLVVARELQSRANSSLMRSWLGRCRCHHNNCARRHSIDVALPVFRVIDCYKSPPDKVERPWSEKYVALSYVWGPPCGDWPQTILDAIEVTKRMGERYLWVDRICIDQTNLKQKMESISRMDAIYQGAEFTIVCASGDARSGLPGVSTTMRRSQPWVELSHQSSKVRGKNAVRFTPGSFGELVGVTEDEYNDDLVGETGWLDNVRFGLRGKMDFDFGELLNDSKLQNEYEITSNHLAWHRKMAEDYGYDQVEDYLDKLKELARRNGIPLKEIVPYMKRELAVTEGFELDPLELNTMPIQQRPRTSSSKPRRPLPPGKTRGRLTLVSSLQEPRVAIKDSNWATRGWTYQEGVLSNRRLVFTDEQVYWECRGMAVCETLDLALNIVHELDGTRMADFMLSGIFDDDLRAKEELQYGFQRPQPYDVGDQVVTLDGHIQAYTSRNLTNGGDALKAFMGVAATYTTNDGLYLLLGLPVWAGAFANDEPGLQHSVALSISSWTHIPNSEEHGAGMNVADCPRRPHFPSWTWAGWEGAIVFCNEQQSKTHRTGKSGKSVGAITIVPGPGPRFIGQGSEFETASTDPQHSDFFKALTSKDWVGGMTMIWSAEMILYSTDGTYASLLSGWTPVRAIGDMEMSWLLTIKKPLVLRRMDLLHSNHSGEWRRLMGRVVSVHLSIPITEAQLVLDHGSGHLVTVLVFASMVPYVYNGISRFLILRRADGNGRWERIGRMNMWMTERELSTFRTPRSMITALPVKPFGEDITIV